MALVTAWGELALNIKKEYDTDITSGYYNWYFEKVKPYLSEHDKQFPPSLFQNQSVNNDYLGESEETKLSNLYRELIIRKGCKVDEFHEVYLSGSIVDLLKKKCNDCSWLIENRIEVWGRKQPIKSVYYLKQCFEILELCGTKSGVTTVKSLFAMSVWKEVGVSS
ncbi:hypothetical protein Glove_682g43 [Diversispora epigaea]|uniref:Uncharacterized protein n=1 Tax=Diversispora epigaea TaxID=1348612 RepID=A0A397G6K8_9GLOM|nr:hypothetical protein Glove_682g43 [Diversispora epigaea]